jgi:hypothetical protein
MIKLILELLRSDDWTETKSDWIELAKGKNELATDWKTAKKKIRRQWQSRK